MTPPASAFKKTQKKEEPPLTAIVMLDVFDQRFAPIQESYPCFVSFFPNLTQYIAKFSGPIQSCKRAIDQLSTGLAVEN